MEKTSNYYLFIILVNDFSIELLLAFIIFLYIILAPSVCTVKVIGTISLRMISYLLWLDITYSAITEWIKESMKLTDVSYNVKMF